MKIAIFGHTLSAAVMAGLWAEVGNTVYWYDAHVEAFDVLCGADESLHRLLHRQMQHQQLRLCQNLDEIPLDTTCYFFAFTNVEKSHCIQLIQQLALRAEIRPKLMVNGGTFGLHGTEELKAFALNDYWVYLPDSIQEGNAIQSFLKREQIVVGVESETAQQLIQALLHPFFPLNQQYLFMPTLDAEFTKLSISGMLATRISYINDLAQVAEKLGIDILNVRQGLATDSRIGSAYLSAGTGFGGENFSYDILTLSNTVLHTGVKSRLLEQVWQINETQKEVLFRKLWNYYQGDLAGRTIAVWGAAFKENTSRIEYSPTLVLLDALFAQGAKVRLHDPQALAAIQHYYGERNDLRLCREMYQAVEQADALCVMTAWKHYYSPDIAILKQQMKHPLILDGRNLYRPEFLRQQGCVYMGVGRT